MVDPEKLMEVIKKRAPIKTTQIRSEYQNETGDRMDVGEDEVALVQLREEQKIRFITEPWKGSCWIVLFDHVDESDYPKVDCNLFW